MPRIPFSLAARGGLARNFHILSLTFFSPFVRWGLGRAATTQSSAEGEDIRVAQADDKHVYNNPVVAML